MKIEFFPTDFQKLNIKFMKIRSVGAEFSMQTDMMS